MCVEFFELFGARVAVVLGGPELSPPVEERSEVSVDVFVIDGGVALRGADILVAEDPGEDVDRQARREGLGGEDAAEIVRGQRRFGAVVVLEAGQGESSSEGVGDGAGGDDAPVDPALCLK